MNVVQELSKLAELHQAGAITSEEYDKAKSLVLAPGHAEVPSAPQVPSATGEVATGGQTYASVAPSCPQWMAPWGWLFVWVGLVGYFASAYYRWNDFDSTQGLIAGFLNPLFFLGVPIGLYWLGRSGVLLRIRNSMKE
ncbi:MAG: SHOCT domain-containing protein [Gemmataceae bacterium]